MGKARNAGRSFSLLNNHKTKELSWRNVKPYLDDLHCQIVVVNEIELVLPAEHHELQYWFFIHAMHFRKVCICARNRSSCRVQKKSLLITRVSGSQHIKSL